MANAATYVRFAYTQCVTAGHLTVVSNVRVHCSIARAHIVADVATMYMRVVINKLNAIKPPIKCTGDKFYSYAIFVAKRSYN